MGIISNIFSPIFWACEFYFIFSHIFLGNFWNKIAHILFSHTFKMGKKLFQFTAWKKRCTASFQISKKILPQKNLPNACSPAYKKNKRCSFLEDLFLCYNLFRHRKVSRFNPTITLSPLHRWQSPRVSGVSSPWNRSLSAPVNRLTYCNRLLTRGGGNPWNHRLKARLHEKPVWCRFYHGKITAILLRGNCSDARGR